MNKPTEVVKCNICGCLCSGQEAGRHKDIHGHNDWELILHETNLLLLSRENKNTDIIMGEVSNGGR